MSRFSPGFLAGSQGNDQYTKILLHLDGNLTDSNIGGSAHTWTAHGSSFVTSGQKFGTGALQCPYIDTPAHADFNLGSGDWTIDFWFDTLGHTDAAFDLAGQTSSTGSAATTSFRLSLSAISVGNMVLAASVSNGTTFTQVAGTTVFTSASAGLNHVEFCRSGSVLKLFLNGIQEGGNVAFTGSVNASTNNLSFGRAGEITFGAFTGVEDEPRLSVGIARHTANFTPPTVQYGP